MTDPGLLIPSIILTVALYVWAAASLQALFRKAGEEGWKGWVPVLSTIVLLRLGGFSGWWVLLAFVPLVNLVFLAVVIIAYHRINLSFGVGVGMTVLAALLFPAWSSILGWGSATWLGGPVVPGPKRQGASAQALDARVAGPYGGFGAPPRPPAPAGAAFAPDDVRRPIVGRAGSPIGAPTGPVPQFASERQQRPPVPTEEESPVAPAFRSTARSALAVSDLDAPAPPALPSSRAPYTGTVPTAAPAEESSAPAQPRRAVIPAGSELRATDAPISDGRAPAPVQSVPPPLPPAPAVDPWAPRVSAPPAADDAGRAIRYSPAPENGDSVFDTSGEVSAVIGAPVSGEPRAARASVSAQQRLPEIPDAEGAFDETILTARRRTVWMLTPPLGVPIAVTSDILIIGRRPAFDPDFAEAQLVPISDETRTMSKTHARLELHGDAWVVVDLDSTNGVILVREDGSESDATPGIPERLSERFLLGDAELRLGKGAGHTVTSAPADSAAGDDSVVDGDTVVSRQRGRPAAGRDGGDEDDLGVSDRTIVSRRSKAGTDSGLDDRQQPDDDTVRVRRSRSAPTPVIRPQPGRRAYSPARGDGFENYPARLVSADVPARSDRTVPLAQASVDGEALDRSIRGKARTRAAGAGLLVLGLLVLSGCLLAVLIVGIPR